ncbi:MAG: sigma-70 family RNA polymerase sigma factor [Planctomycetales bacterium]|nr:sigma-70 family RNA polymerase sigma factor [Planctomycetales bacterium]
MGINRQAGRIFVVAWEFVGIEMDRGPDDSETVPERPDAAAWLRDYGDAMLSYAMRRVAALEVAEDLVQETLVAALRNHSDFAGEASLKTWLIAILRRKIIDHYRRSSRQSTASLDAGSDPSRPFDDRGVWRELPSDWGPTPPERLESQEFMAILRVCIEKLGPTLGPAFEMRVLRELETEEICSLLDISPTNLSVRLNRARQAMRLCLDARWFQSE